MDAGGLGRDADASGERGLEKRDRGVGSGLSRLGGIGSGLRGFHSRLASYDTPAVGLLEVAGLGESIDGGLVVVRECEQFRTRRVLQREPQW